ncbi:MAG: hypothetical protein H5T33_03235 [Candidatus Methanosuratus sp.]|nr:hypothetical protein [Candidatus Methanosuratincola sp.]
MGSNPTQSTKLFALEGKKFDKKLFEFNHLYKPKPENPIHPTIVRYNGEGLDGHLKEFKDFLSIDPGIQPRTVSEHLRVVRAFHRSDLPLSRGGCRAFLAGYSGTSASKANTIKALRKYFRDFLGASDNEWNQDTEAPFLPNNPTIKGGAGKVSLLPPLKHQAIFLVLASSGLSKSEVSKPYPSLRGKLT